MFNKMKQQMILVTTERVSMRGKLFHDIESAYDYAFRQAQLLNVSLEIIETIRNELADRNKYAYEHFLCISRNSDPHVKSVQIILMNLENSVN